MSRLPPVSRNEFGSKVDQRLERSNSTRLELVFSKVLSDRVWQDHSKLFGAEQGAPRWLHFPLGGLGTHGRRRLRRDGRRGWARTTRTKPGGGIAREGERGGGLGRAVGTHLAAGGPPNTWEVFSICRWGSSTLNAPIPFENANVFLLRFFQCLPSWPLPIHQN
jgi:hypothetical protein